ncbi:MAG TPA: gluconate 2-dehydrogenase subunit 3 family protein [Gemmatimonadaceae bacterium]|nr:gluconate 2-dehydrogenase subunit 3 family protein [Gemmatimonadaceae bacterium]
MSSVRHILRAVATTVVPEAASLDGRAWAELETVIEHALAQRDERVRRQLTAFLRLIQVLPLTRYGQPFTRLSPKRRMAFLESIERSPVMLIRRGFWGLRTLIFMGYYTRDDIATTIGYRAHPSGWVARGGTIATVPLAPSLWLEP